MNGTPKQVTVSIGDFIYHDRVLCEITAFNHEELTCKTPNGLHCVLNVGELNERDFEYIIEFRKEKGDLFGKSHTSDFGSAKKEEALLKELGWITKIYKQERK